MCIKAEKVSKILDCRRRQLASQSITLQKPSKFGQAVRVPKTSHLASSTPESLTNK